MTQTVVAYLRDKYPRMASAVQSGLGAIALIVVSLYAFMGLTTLLKQPPQLTVENVEPHIRAWMDTFNLTIQKQRDPASHFSYRVIIPEGIEASVSRMKTSGRYLTIESGVVMSSEDQEIQSIINTLTERQLKRIANEVILEMARLNVQWIVKPMPPKDILLRKRVPITTSLSKDVFLERLLEMGNAVWVARATLIRAVTSAHQSP